MLAPYTACPTPPGYSREEAGTLPDVYKLQTRLQEQELEDAKREAAFDERQFLTRIQAVRSRLVERMVSSSTSPYEREFIGNWLKLRDEKREHYRKIFEQRQFYLRSLEFDAPKGRRDDEESFNAERMG
jgi:hypothetical protein